MVCALCSSNADIISSAFGGIFFFFKSTVNTHDNSLLGPYSLYFPELHEGSKGASIIQMLRYFHTKLQSTLAAQFNCSDQLMKTDFYICGNCPDILLNKQLKAKRSNKITESSLMITQVRKSPTPKNCWSIRSLLWILGRAHNILRALKTHVLAK